MIMQNLGGQTKSIMVFSEEAYAWVDHDIKWLLPGEEKLLQLCLNNAVSWAVSYTISSVSLEWFVWFASFLAIFFNLRALFQVCAQP